MFEAFYGFDNTPFTRGIDTSALFSNNKAEEVLARLQIAASRQWFALLTGDCGTGKSTLIRKLTAMLEKDRAYKFCILPTLNLHPDIFTTAF